MVDLSLALALAVAVPVALFIGYLWGAEQERKKQGREKRHHDG